METNNIDWNGYIADMVAHNRLAQENRFITTSCSGINYLEGMLDHFRNQANFVCTCDVCNQSVRNNGGGGFFTNRVFVVFIVLRFNSRLEGDMEQKMNMARELYRQMLSRIIQDGDDPSKKSICYLDTSQILANEIGGRFLNNGTGLYFQISKKEPIDLCYNQNEWM